MPKRIVGVADLNISGPDTKTLVAQLRTISDGKRPITTDQIAKLLKCSVGQVEYTLNIAKAAGLVKRVKQGRIAS